MIDRSDFERIYQRYSTLVFRRAHKILADRHFAQDVCHDVFIQLLRTKGFQEAPSHVGWLYRTTTNCCLNFLRNRRRWHHLLSKLPPLPIVSPPLPIQLLLRGIPNHLQEIAVYYGVDQMRQDEIALVLGLSQKTVSNRIREIRCWLEEAGTKQRVSET